MAARESNTADREMLATRLFNAPRELVFKLWTDPQHITHWWGPHGFSTTTQSMDLRPGGIWRFVMHGPDGTDYRNKIVFIDVVKPERLVYRHASDDEDVEPVNFEVTVLFEDVGGKTRLSMQMLFPTPEELQYVVEKYGAREGQQQTLDRFEAFLATQV